jgi:hypothetical protein
MKLDARSRALATGILAASLLAGCGNLANVTSSTPSVAPAGSSVRDGKFEFTVDRVTRSKTANNPSDPTNQYELTTAQGEFVIVSLAVRNIGNEQQTFFDINQKLIDSSGRSYGPSSQADSNLDANIGMSDINPGNSVNAQVAFDVPVGTPITAIEVHDSLYSGGAKVAIT